MTDVKISRYGEVEITSPAARKIGWVDKATHTGKPARTWRAVTTGGATVAEGLPTRRDAAHALMKSKGINDD
jgi:alkylated DNA nucleotide flippase Atl1